MKRIFGWTIIIIFAIKINFKNAYQINTVSMSLSYPHYSSRADGFFRAGAPTGDGRTYGFGLF